MAHSTNDDEIVTAAFVTNYKRCNFPNLLMAFGC